MSECFQRNLKEFLKRYSHYEARFSSVDLNSLGQIFSVKEEDGFSLYEGQKLIDSTNPDFLTEFKIPDHAVRVALIHGFGMGTLFQRVVQDRRFSLDDVVIIEPSIERFLYSLSLTEFGSLFANEKFHWLVGLSPEECFSVLFEIFKQFPRLFRMNANHSFTHPVLTKMYSGYFDRIEDEWKAVQKQILRSNGFRSDSILGLSNVVENKEFIEDNPGIRHLKGLFSDIPAIVVASGSSLKKSLPLVKELQDKAIILSADASLSVLLKNGIEPHFVLSLERVLDSKKFFDAIGEEYKPLRSQLVAYPLVPKRVIDAYPGEKWVAYRNQNYFLYFENEVPRGLLHSASSVAHMCVSLANYMDCSTVALVGQDLAYDPETLQSHVEGISYSEWSQKSSIEEINRKLKSQNLGEVVYVPGNLQDEVPTNPTYFSMIKEYSWEAMRLKCKIYNCTVGGAKIPNIEWKSLEEVSASWEKLPDVFAKVEDCRIIDEGESLNWPKLRGFIQEVAERLKCLKEECLRLRLRLRQDESLSEELHQKALQMLRQSVEALEKDPFFQAFVAEMDGQNFIQLENEWAFIKDSDPASSLRYQTLEKWFSNMFDTTQEIFSRLDRLK